MNITPKQVLTLAAKYIGYKEKASDKDSELKNAVSTGDLEAAYKEGVNSI